MSTETLAVNVAALQPESRVNGPGPGNRFVVWVRGCSLSCKGCMNTSFATSNPRWMMTVDDLSNLILSNPDVEGVTYTGGEPFQQVDALLALSEVLKKRGLGIMCYSGYAHAELLDKKEENVHRLLDLLDILVDGRYDEDRAAPLLWRGSTNQRVIFLTKRYKRYQQVVDEEVLGLEIIDREDGISFVGNMDEEMLSLIAQGMKRDFGIILDRKQSSVETAQVRATRVKKKEAQ